jgi:hypothetical protein
VVGAVAPGPVRCAEAGATIASAATIATLLNRYFMTLILPLEFWTGRGMSDTHPAPKRVMQVNDARTISFPYHNNMGRSGTLSSALVAKHTRPRTGKVRTYPPCAAHTNSRLTMSTPQS